MYKETILITVKTYPNISSKYTELVCTAGLRSDGSWIRIYPVPFRLLSDDKQFKKYSYIRAPIHRNPSDSRPESFKITNSEEIEILSTIDTKNNWRERKDIIFKSQIYTNIEQLIHAANKLRTVSLATFKPSKIIAFYSESNGSEKWTEDEIKKFQNANNSLFQDIPLISMPKVPYKFKIEFEDDAGKKSKMTILDWEFSQLYLNYRVKAKFSAKEAKSKVIERLKYLNETCEIYFFLGTTNRFDGWANNPFTIIGIFYPKKEPFFTPSLF